MERVSANFDIELSDKTIFVIGIVFTVAAVGLWVFTGFNILMREQLLSDADLSLEERWRVEGSLLWWKDSSTRLLYPLGTVLFGAGLTVMLSVLLLSQSIRSLCAGAIRIVLRAIRRGLLSFLGIF